MGRLISYAEATALTGIPHRSLAKRVAAGEVPHVRLGPRTVRFDEEELRAWLEARRVPRSES